MYCDYITGVTGQCRRERVLFFIYTEKGRRGHSRCEPLPGIYTLRSMSTCNWNDL